MDLTKDHLLSLVHKISLKPLSEEEISDVQSKVIKILEGDFDFSDSFKKLQKDIYSLPRFVVHIPMFYRDTVWLHHERLALLWPCIQYMIILWEELSSKEKEENFDFTYFTELLARHDEAEVFSPFWDIPTHIKYTLLPEEINLLKQVEESVETYISHNFQSVEYYNEPDSMMRLFRDSREKESLESQLMSYLDKIDGYMMALHEVTAGNTSFVEPLSNYITIFKRIHEWTQLPLLTPFFKISFEQYRKYLNEFHQEDEEYTIYYWFLQFWHLFDVKSLLLTWEEIETLITSWVPHSEDDVERSDFWIPAYLSWKLWVIRGWSSFLFHLTNQTEF